MIEGDINRKRRVNGGNQRKWTKMEESGKKKNMCNTTRKVIEVKKNNTHKKEMNKKGMDIKYAKGKKRKHEGGGGLMNNKTEADANRLCE